MAGFGVAVMLVTALAMRETVAADLSRLKPGALAAAYAHVLADRRFLVAAGIVSCAIGALYAQATFLPFILMARVGLSPAEFGLGMLFQSGSFLLGSLLTRSLMERVGAARLVAPGLGFIALGSAGLLLLNLNDPSFLGVMLPVAAYAVGIAFVMPATTTAALAPFPEHAGAAAAMMGFLQMGLGLAVGTLGAALGDPVRAMGCLIPAMGASACLLYRGLSETKRS
jgi:DHA1 family bicyclomycin/chloramphenicol resistance-like MFS transporter